MMRVPFDEYAQTGFGWPTAAARPHPLLLRNDALVCQRCVGDTQVAGCVGKIGALYPGVAMPGLSSGATLGYA